MDDGGDFERLVAQARQARVGGDLLGAASAFQEARLVGLDEGLGADAVLSLLIQEAICATDAGLFDQAVEALDEFDRVTGPKAPPWAAAQARLARAAVADARARESANRRPRRDQ